MIKKNILTFIQNFFTAEFTELKKSNSKNELNDKKK